MNFQQLLSSIEKTHNKLISQAYSQINYYSTIRNWLIGYFTPPPVQAWNRRGGAKNTSMPAKRSIFARGTPGTKWNTLIISDSSFNQCLKFCK